MRFQCQNYEVLEQVIKVGGIESTHPVTVKLTPLNSPVITVHTNPAASLVEVDGKDVGVTKDDGILLLPNVDWGGHQISVSHNGYRTVITKFGVHGPQNVHLELVNEAVAAKQAAEER